MDKELIEMCKAPEIQEKWEPKVGDRYWHMPRDEDRCREGYYTHSSQDLSGSPEHGIRNIYIPRIEDVLEWLGDRWFSLVRQNDEELCGKNDWRWIMGTFDEQGITEDTGFDDSPIKALIKSFMYIKHNKSWNGEEWLQKA